METFEQYIPLVLVSFGSGSLACVTCSVGGEIEESRKWEEGRERERLLSNFKTVWQYFERKEVTHLAQHVAERPRLTRWYLGHFPPTGQSGLFFLIASIHGDTKTQNTLTAKLWAFIADWFSHVFPFVLTAKARTDHVTLEIYFCSLSTEFSQSRTQSPQAILGTRLYFSY